jgi:hypothetical protein
MTLGFTIGEWRTQNGDVEIHDQTIGVDGIGMTILVTIVVKELMKKGAWGRKAIMVTTLKLIQEP